MILGFDIGSSNSSCAYWDGNTARMIEINASGATMLPSVITIADDQVYIGQEAIEKGRQYPDFMFRHFKRRIGERWNDEEDTGYQTCAGPDGMLHFRGPGSTTYSPVEFYSFLIGAMVDAANAYLAPHDSVTGAVLCVPADFTPAQNEAVKEAARLAGLTDFSLIEEPVAAAMANGADGKKARRYAVIDLGGGTLDLSAVATGGGYIRVVGKNGIRNLGGEDWDDRITDLVVNLFRTETGTDLALKDAPMIRIGVEAEAVKKRLSDKQETTFRIDDVDRTPEGVALHMIYKIDQRIFEDITSDLRERITASCKALIADIKRDDPNFSVNDFHEVWLVGGMTRCPSVRQTVTDFFRKAPKKDGVPEQVVALGAAMKAAIIEGRRPDVTVANVTNHAFGIETVNNVPAILIPRNKSYPFEEKFTLSNPDADQTELSVRWLIADRPKATECEVIWAAELPLEPCAAETARIPMSVKMDESGKVTIRCLDQAYEGVG